MDVFPFAPEEWAQVQNAAHGVLNATLAGDAVLCASHFEELRVVLYTLRGKYGDHPVLLETEADFAGEPSEQRDLYRRAIETAIASGLPAYSIRLSLARVLLDDFDQPGEALHELTACEPQLTALGDEHETQDWRELVTRCERLIMRNH